MGVLCKGGEEGKKCTRRALYNYTGYPPRYCSHHISEGMIDVYNKKCIKCGKSSRYVNDLGERVCHDHMGSNSVATFKTCLKCIKTPYFNYDGESIGIYCSDHIEPGMIDVKSKKCEESGCKTCPSFGYHGNTAIRCGTHKLEGMVNLKCTICIYEGCVIRASFNVPGGKALFCESHKDSTMINVNSLYLMCNYLGCESRATYGNIGGRRQFCVKHKELTMIDLDKKFCQYDGCNIGSSYGYEGGKKQYCGAHRLDGMINLIYKSCVYKDCKISPAYNIRGKPKMYCWKHKLPNMINVISKVCDYENCIDNARYGVPGQGLTRCSVHREMNMIINPNATCKNKSCNNLATYGFYTTPQHCELHKQEGEDNITERPCIKCGLSFILNKNNHCMYCDPDSFKSARLAKQNALMNYLDYNNLKGDSTDKIVDKGVCGKERPDRLYYMKNFVVILECDENQHMDRDCTCEQTRMINITQSFGGLPTYFIRFNPDDYVPEDEDADPEPIPKRYETLKNMLQALSTMTIQEHIGLTSVIYLYFDGWSCLQEQSWQVLLPFEKDDSSASSSSSSSVSALVSDFSDISLQ